MIKHSIQLIEWLGGVGSTKSRILPDETQFDQDVRLTYDLSNAPGMPMGPPMSACGVFSQVFAIGEVINCSFNGGSGGAMLKRFRVADSTNTALGADSIIRFNNHNIAARVQATNGVIPSNGGRQFDDRSNVPASGNTRLLIPMNSVVLLTDPNLAVVPAIAGEDRPANFFSDGGWHNANIYIPPGDSGWAFTVPFVLPAAVTMHMDMEFDIYPLPATGLPK